MDQPIKAYLGQIKHSLATGATTEHTHRPALAALLESTSPGVQVINEPRRIACGAPDLGVLKNRLMVGHVEAKDIGASLDAVERSPQLGRYRQALDNLILTDYVEFRWYVGGDLRRSARLARWDGGRLKTERGGAQALAGLLADFVAHAPQPIGTPRELAERLARLAHLIREIIVTAFETGQASDFLQGWRAAFAKILVADLDQPEKIGEFADMFAQTLAYGLFSARVMDESAATFDRQRAQHLIPRTNPFLRDFFYHITGPRLDDEPYSGFVNDLVQLLAHADMEAILTDFGKRTRQEDPIVHFYETFLAAYNPRLREMRGVYYTPAPVVSFIVRSVDALLKTKFGLPSGLADTSQVTVKNVDPGLRVQGKPSQIRKTTQVHKVLILDPATGTATFPYAVIDFIREQFMRQGNAGMWSGYVREHLLPRIFGFELLMAPYAVAHFKLALQLAGHDLSTAQRARWAYDFASDERIQVYLTNALEGPHEFTGLPLFTQFLAAETQAANAVKQDLPIMVVLGNPPYSGHSANKGKWISDLLRGKLPDGGKTASYYEVDGQSLGERNPKWLQDDYVKFIRFGQWRIEQSGSGILAFISNHGYLDNPTFRGMRQSLMETFTEIYLLDLHGSARKKETAPDGSPDENVFDIMQGVAIGLFVKEPGKPGPAKVYHADLWGKREDKYHRLWELDVTTTEWQELKPQETFYLFVKQDIALKNEYQNGWQTTDIFPLTRMGVTSGDDSFAYDWSRVDLAEKITKILATGKWAKKSQVRAKILANLNHSHLECIYKATYRAFDCRQILFSTDVVWRPVEDLGNNFIRGENTGLITIRRSRTGVVNNFFITDAITDKGVISSVDNAHISPLYLYPEENGATLFDAAALSPYPPDPAHGNRVPNLAPAFVQDMEAKLGFAFAPREGDACVGETFGPEDVLAYAYAIFHSPTYRERYAEFLKIDFPRLPLTSDAALFWRLVALGRELVALHLLESAQAGQYITHYPIPGDNEVARRGGYPKYTSPGGGAPNPQQATGGRVHINKTQYFEGVPEDVWEFQVGGYQVLHKWLKDRRGRLLTFDDLTHYQKIVVALQETMRLMAEIDNAIPEWPMR
ncbi:MAG: DNA methyltransferase [Chloroflexi bacterium]|nr:MAG: DNA methyltransferase [Chloroflexota bacterium]